jgi:hypothetical protein
MPLASNDRNLRAFRKIDNCVALEQQSFPASTAITRSRVSAAMRIVSTPITGTSTCLR